MEALELLSVTRRFGSLTAVEDVTLSVHPGEMYALVGPYGAGKTTTIRMLCGITLPTSG
jgi:ABC-2 type transport system ATP-binding protein